LRGTKGKSPHITGKLRVKSGRGVENKLQPDGRGKGRGMIMTEARIR